LGGRARQRKFSGGKNQVPKIYADTKGRETEKLLGAQEKVGIKGWGKQRHRSNVEQPKEESKKKGILSAEKRKCCKGAWETVQQRRKDSQKFGEKEGNHTLGAGGCDLDQLI